MCFSSSTITYLSLVSTILSPSLFVSLPHLTLTFICLIYELKLSNFISFSPKKIVFLELTRIQCLDGMTCNIFICKPIILASSTNGCNMYLPPFEVNSGTIFLLFYATTKYFSYYLVIETSAKIIVFYLQLKKVTLAQAPITRLKTIPIS